LPVGISFVGPAFSEGKLLGLGYAFEQATKARRLPAYTPPLKGEKLSLSPK
jgi:amidase